MEPCRALVIDGRYRLDEEIGRGGVGVVWRAHSLTLDIPCALKFLLPEYARDPSHRARFLHEARAAASLRSSHTVLVFDVDEWDGVPYLAMELLRGETLEERLLAQRTLSPELTCEIVDQIARGLSKAHAAGLVHRDLKPDNVFLVEEDGALLVKILDFGIAKRAHGPSEFKTMAGTLVGTPYYMSPEQSRGSKDVDHRSDLWSLAVVAYRCLTDRLPFFADSLPEILLQIVHGPIPTLLAANPALPEGVDAWWRAAADRDPMGRPASAVELAKGLRRALFPNDDFAERPNFALSGTHSRPPTLVSDEPPRARRRGRVPLVLAALVVSAAVAYVLFRGGIARDRLDVFADGHWLPFDVRPTLSPQALVEQPRAAIAADKGTPAPAVVHEAPMPGSVEAVGALRPAPAPAPVAPVVETIRELDERTGGEADRSEATAKRGPRVVESRRDNGEAVRAHDSAGPSDPHTRARAARDVQAVAPDRVLGSTRRATSTTPLSRPRPVPNEPQRPSLDERLGF